MQQKVSLTGTIALLEQYLCVLAPFGQDRVEYQAISLHQESCMLRAMSTILAGSQSMFKQNNLQQGSKAGGA